VVRLKVLLARHRAAAIALAGCVALGAAAGALSFALQPDTHGSLGPGAVTIDVGLRASETNVDIPPLGRLVADSHAGPVGFDVRVDRIDLEQAGALAGDLARGSDPATQIRENIDDDMAPLLRDLILRSFGVAVVAGVVVGFLLPRRRVRYVAATTVGSVGFVVVAGVVAFTSFSPRAFDQPRFEGSLAAAPDIVNTVQRHIDDVSVVESRLEALSARLVGLYRSVEGTGVGAPSATDTTLLHVSDLHSNPVGIELVEETAERFGVDAIIDTGDLTSFGASLEELVVQRIAGIDVPYYVVPGNHDHERIRQALVEAGVEVLDPGIARVGDVRILGVGDPTFTADNRLPRRLYDAQLERAAEDLERRVGRLRPDVVAVHSARQLTDTTGGFDVGLAGHTHGFDLRYEDGSVILETGSAGATGVGAFTESDDLPYQMQLLQFEEDRLVAVDRLSFEGTEGAFRLERILIDPSKVKSYPDSEDTTLERGPFAPLFRFPN
jgi:predicted phosphodiesterase